MIERSNKTRSIIELCLGLPLLLIYSVCVSRLMRYLIVKIKII